MAKKRKKTRKKSYMGIEPTSTFTAAAVSIPVVYGTLGAAARVSAPAASAASKMLPSVGTGFNMMGMTGMTQGATGVIGAVRQLKKVSTKKKRR